MRFREVPWQSDEERLLFIEEARECLAALEQGALADSPPVDAMFRAAHTLKGSGGMLDLTQWVETVHQLENELDRLRHGERAFDPALQQQTLGTVDALRAELAGEEMTAPVPGGEQASRSPAPEHAQPGSAAAIWTLRWKATCAMPGVRTLQAWQAVDAVAPGTQCDPPIESLASWSGEESRLLLPHGADPAQVRAALAPLAEDLMQLREPASDTAGRHDPNPAPEAPASAASPAGPTPNRDATIRVGAQTLERVLEGLGELLLDQAQLEHRFGGTSDTATRAVLSHMRGLALDLQDTTLRARMLPLNTLFRQYPRAIHDIARKLDKNIQLVTRGGDTELDRIVMDRLHEPLLHLLRNACDHGIESPEARRAAGKPETGTVRLSAYAAQGHVHVLVEDDGGGIDWDRLRSKASEVGWLTPEEASQASREVLTEVLFRPGVSTAEQVTDLSGRGVGLDAVRVLLDSIHGTVSVESTPRGGTTFHLELPMTMAIMTALLVDAGPWTVGLPILTVERIEERTHASVGSVLGQAAVSDSGTPLSVYPLATLLEPDVSTEPAYLVRVRDGRTRAALAVDRVRGQQEVVVKPVPALAGLASWMTGVALLGDGRLALMLDIRRLIPITASEPAASEDDGILRAGSNQMELLVFRLSNGQRYGINVYKTREVLPAQPLVLVANEHPWVQGLLRLRGQTVPVVSLHRSLGMPVPDQASLVLVTEFNHTVQAFPVDAVERMVRVRWDQVEALPAHLEAASPEGRRLTGLVDHPDLGPVQLIDFEQILAQISPPTYPDAAPAHSTSLQDRSVWLADDSAVARHQIEKALAPLQASVKSFPDGQALWDALPTAPTPPDLFVLDVEMPRLDGYTLTQQIKSDPRWRHIPVVLHTSLSGYWHAERVQRVGAEALLAKFEPELLAKTVAGMIDAPRGADGLQS